MNSRATKTRNKKTKRNTPKRNTSTYNKNKRVKNIIIDTTKADKISRGIMDIDDTPDTAVWSNELAQGNVTKKMPAVRGPIIEIHSTNKRHNVNKTTTTIGRNRKDYEKRIKHSRIIIDPANTKEVSEVISSSSILTDKSDLSSHNLTHTKPKMSHTDTNKIIKFHGTRVDNVIIHHTSTLWENPEKIAVLQFDASKITGEFQTINIQAVADYITITYYKEENANVVLQREMIPSYKVEHIWIKDSK
jgi:hypothetical protein